MEIDFSRKQTWSKSGAVLIGFLMVLLIGWIGDGIKGDPLFTGTFLEKTYAENKQFSLVTMIFFWFVLLGIIKLIWPENIMINSANKINNKKEYKKIVIAISKLDVTLSKINNEWVVKHEKSGIEEKITIDHIKEPGKLDQRIASEGKNGATHSNISPLFKGLNPNYTALEEICLISSKGTDAGTKSVREMLIDIFKPRVISVSVSQNFDENDIEETCAAINDAIYNHGHSDSQTIVDITSGNKTMSIAMALATLNRDIHLQYSSPPGTELKRYNILAQSKPSMQ